MNVCIAHNLVISLYNKKTPIVLTDRSFLFSVFFYIIPLNGQELPVELVVYP